MLQLPYFLCFIIKMASFFIRGSRKEADGMFYAYIGLLILLRPLLMFPLFLINQVIFS